MKLKKKSNVNFAFDVGSMTTDRAENKQLFQTLESPSKTGPV
jgi:hypothetical protein